MPTPTLHILENKTRPTISFTTSVKLIW